MSKQLGSISRIDEWAEDLTEIRRDIHAHPELGFEENRTSDIVAAKLAEFGCEVHRGLGKTGVVGTLRVGNSTRSVGLRADMDALPILEANSFGHRSIHDGKMHACGHCPLFSRNYEFRRSSAFYLSTGRRGYWWSQGYDRGWFV